MKKSTILTGLLLLSFFLPWVDFSNISFSENELPYVLGQFRTLTERGSVLILFAFCIPQFLSAWKIAGAFKLLPFPEILQKSDFLLALMMMGFLLYFSSNYSHDYTSFLGFGFYATVIVAVLGLVVKDGEKQG
jgi:hypothetical protein